MSPSTESSISCALAFAFNERKRARSSAVVWRYYRASRAWIAARGRVLLQCIAVTTTCQSAARSSDLTTAMRMLWRVAMGFRGAPHSPPRAVRALRPPRGQRWHRSQHHVAANDLARVCGPCWLELLESSFTRGRVELSSGNRKSYTYTHGNQSNREPGECEMS